MVNPIRSQLPLHPPAPLKMVISGSGPSGLACALEAIRKGYRPILLEKRPCDQAGRIQAVLLNQNVIAQLERHGIYSKLLNQNLIFPVTNYRCSVRLRDLEHVMREAIVEATGDQNFIRYNESITAIDDRNNKANLTLSSGEVIERVDLVVNAEGFRSSTNELLNNRRVEVLTEKIMVNSILVDDRPTIENAATFFESAGKTMRNVACAVRDHTIYIFLLIFTQEHFLSPTKTIAIAILVNTPHQHQVSFAFSEQKTAEIEQLRNDVEAGIATREELDASLQFWTRMSICEVNIFSTMEKIRHLFFDTATILTGASPLPIQFSNLIKIRSDHAEHAAIRRHSTLFLMAGDAYSAVDPSTGLGCNTGIEVAKSVRKAIKQIGQSEDLVEVSARYTTSYNEFTTRNHQLARSIRQQFFY